MMDMIAGYRIEDEIYRSGKSLVFRAVREADSQKVAIKTPNSEYPGRKEIARFQHEYHLTKSLSHVPGVIHALGLERAGNGLAMVMEYFDGMNLAQHLQASRAAAKTPWRDNEATCGIAAGAVAS